MKTTLAQANVVYAPGQHKTFAGALGAFFEQECPQLGGSRTRQVLVQQVQTMVEQFYPETSRLRSGQVQWTAVAADETASYGKSIRQTRLQSVVLDLVRPDDVLERAHGRRLKDVKKEATARLFRQAHAQQGCLTHADVAILLKMSYSTVCKYVREWEDEHQRLLPRRGTLHDMGPTLTHKRQIVFKLFHEGKSVEQVCRETDHSPDAVHRYVVAFKQVLLCLRKGLSVEETAYAVHHSPRLVAEYRRLIREIGKQNPVLENLLKYEDKTPTKESMDRS
jgi:DNA-binding NarL/FixJ family response regulator